MDAPAWEGVFTSVAGIDADSSSKYAKTFADQRMTRAGLAALDRAALADLGVTIMGHVMAILAIPKQPAPAPAPVVIHAPAPVTASSYAKPPAATAPQITETMTLQQWRKLEIDWQVFVTITNLGWFWALEP